MHFNTIDLWFNPRETGAKKGDHVIVSTERGTEFGLVTQDPFEVGQEEVKGELKPVIRVATEKDLEQAESLARRGDETMKLFRQLIKESGLDMKPVGVEFLFGGEKAVFYFAAEDRVDFRDLIRDLSANLHVRVDMRQIGVRDEARLVGGYAPCGQELCCVRFGGEFEPVSIRMAKEQDLPLNSAKISGVCGRLMCCLRYEFEAYRDFKGRAPKRNAVIDTPLGKGKIVEYNTPKEQIVLRLEGGKTIRVDLADMTASEAACKKSQELGCACRPDTVTREVLEKLQSPDVQMALAELDRKNGVIPAEGPDASDIFVDTKKRRRERPSNQKGEAKSPVEGTRRRRGGESRSAAEQPAAAQEGRRRKRRPSGEGGAQTAAPAHMKQAADTAEPKAGGATRRRHHRAEGAGANGGASAAEQERQQPRGGGMRPRRRRPGDKGGQAAQQGPAPKQQGQGGKGSAQGGQGQQAIGENKPRRRRRRRGNGGGQGGEGAASGE